MQIVRYMIRHGSEIIKGLTAVAAVSSVVFVMWQQNDMASEITEHEDDILKNEIQITTIQAQMLELQQNMAQTQITCSLSESALKSVNKKFTYLESLIDDDNGN